MWPRNKIAKGISQTFEWFHENDLKGNQDKCNFLSSLDINTKFSLPASILENLNSQKRLGVTIEKKLNFNEHVTNLCDKASKNIQTLARICHMYPKHKNGF